MDNYLFRITSAKGVHLDYLLQEISIIIEAHKTENEITRIQRVPAMNCLLLTSDNLKLRTALLKDKDFILV
jgi:hypothetical protein